MAIHGTGAIRSPRDPRDWRLPTSASAVEAVEQAIADGVYDPAACALSYLGPVLDQGATPECVAFMEAGAKAYEEHRQLGRWPRYDTQRAYDQAQARDGIPLPHDGTTIRAMLGVARDLGLRDMNSGHTYLIGSYYNLLDDADPIRSAGVAIGAFGRPVPIAFAFYPSWNAALTPDDLWPGGIMPDPRGDPDGGHAVWVWGVRRAPSTIDVRCPDGSHVRLTAGERILRCRWAWGAEFGNGHGNADLPEHVFDQVAHDLWATVDR